MPRACILLHTAAQKSLQSHLQRDLEQEEANYPAPLDFWTNKKTSFFLLQMQPSSLIID